MNAGRSALAQRGSSVLEALIASFIGILALSGILYLYKSQHKAMSVQGGLADMRVNGQYALNELQYYLQHAGLGLPSGLPDLFTADGDLVVRINWSKKASPAEMDPGSGSGRVRYRIPRADTALFNDKAYAAVLSGTRSQEAEITRVQPIPGDPSKAMVEIAGDRDDYPDFGTVYPVDRVRLHHAMADGAETRGGEFHVRLDNPNRRAGLDLDSLVLAEGIEGIRFRFLTLNRDTLSAPPADLDSLYQIEIRVAARSLAVDRHKAGDGIARDTLAARVGYRRSL
jgi:hypothetical protein